MSQFLSPMTFRAARRVLIPLLVGFALVVTFIRAQPYTTPDHLDMLLPPGCDLPCPLGIIPGETTGQQALDMLEAHPFVETVI
ncbi:MAG: hypothetical protein AAF125_21510, partial [Chloroflexota bacterium]